jgi:hypothetical protein
VFLDEFCNKSAELFSFKFVRDGPRYKSGKPAGPYSTANRLREGTRDADRDLLGGLGHVEFIL